MVLPELLQKFHVIINNNVNNHNNYSLQWSIHIKQEENNIVGNFIYSNWNQFFADIKHIYLISKVTNASGSLKIPWLLDLGQLLDFGINAIYIQKKT